MIRPNPCPFEVDVDQPCPKGVPPLLFNLRLHAGHGCASEAALREVCRKRGHLKRVSIPPAMTEAANDGDRATNDVPL